jgi:hypothetical protein
VLKGVHDKGSRPDRLYFFFAGHGMSAYSDAANAVGETAMIPPEVEDLAAEANQLTNFDDFRRRLEGAGPAEQFFFFDACRDLAFGERPGNLPKVGWPASLEPSPGPTAQAALFAVSPGGRALALRHGMGVMTGHLIAALGGHGVALDWADDLDAHVVTAQSVTRHVQACVMATVAGEEGWRHQVMLPELRPTGGPLARLRIVENPPEPALTLRFDPEEAAADTTVELTLRGNPLHVPRWPPCRHGEPVKLRPMVYRIRAESRRGAADADPARIDLREVDRATIRVRGGPPAAARIDEPRPGGAGVRSAGDIHFGVVGPVAASVRANAQEPAATVELLGQDPPYRQWEATGELVEDEVPPGAYLVRFRLGPEVFSQADYDLVAGETKYVVPGGGGSPLLAETGTSDADGSVVVSESIGPMRSTALLTVLPLLGVVPFDTTEELFQRLRPLMPQLDIADFQEQTVRKQPQMPGRWESADMAL